MFLKVKETKFSLKKKPILIWDGVRGFCMGHPLTKDHQGWYGLKGYQDTANRYRNIP